MLYIYVKNVFRFQHIKIRNMSVLYGCYYYKISIPENLLSLCITNRYYKKPMNSNYGIIIDKERKSVKLHIHTREYTKLTHHSLCIPVRRLLDFFFMFFIIIFFSFFYFRRTRRTITRRRNVMHGQKYWVSNGSYIKSNIHKKHLLSNNNNNNNNIICSR